MKDFQEGTSVAPNTAETSKKRIEQFPLDLAIETVLVTLIEELDCQE